MTGVTEGGNERVDADMTESASGTVPRLTAITVAALQGTGRLVRTDWEQETFDVLPVADGGPAASGVILHSSHAVALYVVWDEFVPADKRAEVADWSVRANTDLTTCAIEFSLDTGILAVRTVVRVGGLVVGAPGDDPAEYDEVPGTAPVISRAAFAVMLGDALADVESTYTRLAADLNGILAAT